MRWARPSTKCQSGIYGVGSSNGEVKAAIIDFGWVQKSFLFFAELCQNVVGFNQVFFASTDKFCARYVRPEGLLKWIVRKCRKHSITTADVCISIPTQTLNDESTSTKAWYWFLWKTSLRLLTLPILLFPSFQWITSFLNCQRNCYLEGLNRLSYLFQATGSIIGNLRV